MEKTNKNRQENSETKQAKKSYKGDEPYQMWNIP